MQTIQIDICDILHTHSTCIPETWYAGIVITQQLSDHPKRRPRGAYSLASTPAGVSIDGRLWDIQIIIPWNLFYPFDSWDPYCRESK